MLAPHPSPLPAGRERGRGRRNVAPRRKGCGEGPSPRKRGEGAGRRMRGGDDGAMEGAGGGLRIGAATHSGGVRATGWCRFWRKAGITSACGPYRSSHVLLCRADYRGNESTFLRGIAITIIRKLLRKVAFQGGVCQGPVVMLAEVVSEKHPPLMRLVGGRAKVDPYLG